MSEGERSANQHRPAAPTGDDLERDDDRLLEILRLLIDAGKVRSPQDLMKYTQQAGTPAAVSRLKELLGEGLPLDLTFDALSVYIRIVSYKRNSTLLRGCHGKRIGLVLPLPPHVIDSFLALGPATPEIMQTPGHHLPPALERLHDRVIADARACRERAGALDVLVFEVCRAGERLLASSGVADVVDARVLSPEVLLIAHVRAHPNPEDVELRVGRHKVNLL
jgi:hypothetical protein